MCNFMQTTINFSDHFKQSVNYLKELKGGEHDISEEALELQYSYIKEKFNELEEAYITRDSTQWTYNLRDLFIHTTYYIYLDQCINTTKSEESIFKSLSQTACYPNQTPMKLAEMDYDLYIAKDIIGFFAGWYDLAVCSSIDLGEVITKLINNKLNNGEINDNISK